MIAKYSLKIYREHIFAYHLFNTARYRYGTDHHDRPILAGDLTGGVAILALAVGLRLVASVGISAVPGPQPLVFSRDWAELPNAFVWNGL